jgi:peptide/nickel transport system ATP-binding protein
MPEGTVGIGQALRNPNDKGKGTEGRLDQLPEMPLGDEGARSLKESLREPVLEARDLCVEFTTKAGTAKVLNSMTIACRDGQTVGLVGESGSGKTVLAGALVGRVRRPGVISGGKVIYSGQNLLELPERELRPIRGPHIGMIVSNAYTALNPLLCVGDQVANIYMSHKDASRKEARQKALETIRSTGINDPEARYSSYPHELSGGMVKRIIIAAALVLEPRVVIADEPTSGLDVTVQAQVLDSLSDLIASERTAATVLMTRDLGIIAQYCTNVLVTYGGEALEEASVQRFFEGPTHPYSILLLSAARLETARWSKVAKTGPPPNKFDLPQGCLFRERCLAATRQCEEGRPIMEEIESGHYVRCWRWAEL